MTASKAEGDGIPSVHEIDGQIFHSAYGLPENSNDILLDLRQYVKVANRRDVQVKKRAGRAGKLQCEKCRRAKRGYEVWNAH